MMWNLPMYHVLMSREISILFRHGYFLRMNIMRITDVTQRVYINTIDGNYIDIVDNMKKIGMYEETGRK